MKDQVKVQLMLCVSALVLGFFLGKSYTSETIYPVASNVQVKEIHRVDTIFANVAIAEREFIAVAQPTLRTESRAILDTMIQKDSSALTLHIEYNTDSLRFENVIAAFTAQRTVKILKEFIDREISITRDVALPDTDDLQWFGIGSAAGVALSIITFLLLAL